MRRYRHGELEYRLVTLRPATRHRSQGPIWTRHRISPLLPEHGRSGNDAGLGESNAARGSLGAHVPDLSLRIFAVLRERQRDSAYKPGARRPLYENIDVGWLLLVHATSRGSRSKS